MNGWRALAAAALAATVLPAPAGGVEADPRCALLSTPGAVTSPGMALGLELLCGGELPEPAPGPAPAGPISPAGAARSRLLTHPVMFPNNRVNDPIPDPGFGDHTHITQNQPVLAVDPANPNLVFVGYTDSTHLADTGTLSALGGSYSTNGGATWADLGEIPSGDPAFNDASLGDPAGTFDPMSGRWYVVSTFCRFNTSQCPIAFHSTSDPPSGNWTVTHVNPLIPTTDFHHTPSVAVDSGFGPNAGRIYVAYVNSSSGSSQIEVVGSTDGGQTFSPPAIIGPDPCGAGGAFTFRDFPRLGVDGNGAVGTVYSCLNDPGGPSRIMFSRSTDGGATFSAPTIVRDVPGPIGNTTSQCEGFNIGTRWGDYAAHQSPDLDFDFNTGTWFTAHVEGAGPDGDDVKIHRSTDGGSFWQPVPGNLGAPNNQFNPQVAVDPATGTVVVTYYDARLDPTNNRNVDIFASTSRDGGATFGAPLRVTTQSSSPPEVNPQFDTFLSDCTPPFHATMFPGSGVYTAWWDTRDTGPAANNGVDPNVYFASFEVLCPGYETVAGNHVVGGPGDDHLQGTPGRDIACGLGGNDQMTGADGNDILVGGPGRDRLVGGNDNDRLLGGGGGDVLRGGRGRDRLDGGGGRDDCEGGPDRDREVRC